LYATLNQKKLDLFEPMGVGEVLCKIPRFARDFATCALRESTFDGFYNSNI